MEINSSLLQGALHGLLINKKNITLITILLLGIFLIVPAFISAQADVSYCCEKTTAGAWCQDAPQNECDSSYRSIPTSCEATSYCKLGTCINSPEGTCMENTPEVVCDEAGGLWDPRESDEIPQCQLGCCLIGDQAAFVTQTRCKKLSTDYNLETNYRTDIQNEIQCIASASPDVKGACVFEQEFERTCRLLTRTECQDLKTGSPESLIEFHEGFLCSAEDLATNCGPSKQTTCVEGKDQVYFVDTCGNLANVYDSSKQGDANYWSEIQPATCGIGSNNANSVTCGSCDYFLGSTCKQYDRSVDNAKPTYGDNICRSLGCKDGDFENTYGRNPLHGETWCAATTGDEKVNSPGGRHLRLICYNGDVTIEPCGDFRQQVCLQSGVSISGTDIFKTAACRANLWQDCAAQDNEQDCENPDKRDCDWINTTRFDSEGNKIENVCVPAYAPGFDFWNPDGDATSLCSLASTQCVVTIEKGVFGDGEITSGSECAELVDGELRIKDSWQDGINNMCVSLGDCGSKTNYVGARGFYNQSPVAIDGERQD